MKQERHWEECTFTLCLYTCRTDIKRGVSLSRWPRSFSTAIIIIDCFSLRLWHYFYCGLIQTRW